MDKQMWLVYAALAGVCWGTYVPFVQQGIQGLGRNALASFLCVGVAYFLIAVLYPIGTFIAEGKSPAWNAYGISMATLAGAAGAAGALCVILANRAAFVTYGPIESANYRLYIAPIIFALAPVLNALISTIWHPSPAHGPFHFGLEHTPNWKLWVGILLTGAGAALVLYSKEEAERSAQRPAISEPRPSENIPGGTKAP